MHRLFSRCFVANIGRPVHQIRHRVNLALRAGDGHLANIEAAMSNAPMLSRRRYSAWRKAQDDEAARGVDQFHASDRSQIG